MSSSLETDSGVAVTSNTSASAAFKKAKLSVLEEIVSSQMDSSGNAAVSSAVSSYSTPSRAMPQQKTVVQFNVISVKGEALGDEVPVARSSHNL